MVNALNFQQPIILAKRATDPSAPVDSALYFNTVSNTIRIFFSSAWHDLSTGSTNLVGQTLGQNAIIVGDGSSLSASLLTTSVGDVKADSSTGLTIKSGVIVNAQIASAAAIALTKLAALSNHSRALASDASGFITEATTTTAELNFLSGVTSAVQTQLNATEKSANKGAANGYAPLDGSSKIPFTYLPSVVMQYEGAWDPTTNTPALADGSGTNGFVYYVTAAKLTAVSGLTDPSMVNFQLGDLVIYSDSVGKYQLVTPAAGVSSVNGSQGAVTVNAINQLTGDVTATAATGSQSKATTITTGAVTATKLGTVTDGVTLDQGGAGSTLQVKALGISDAHVATAAAIALSKLASLTVDRIPSVDHTTGKLVDTDAANDKALISLSMARGTSSTALVKEQYIDATTLTDNTSSAATILSVPFATYYGVEISYIIETGAGTPDVRMGTARIVGNGTTVSIVDTFTETADIGVIFSATTVSTNTVLQYTSTTQGSNRLLRMDVKFFRK